VHKTISKALLAGLLSVASLEAADISNGEVIFSKLCWGCHHQTAEAFGPSFSFIANNRTDGQIKGQIIRPDLLFKELGYKRNSMPPFKLNGNELGDITEYIKSFK
jgi:mono/diheme cytochrome c family protein